MIGRNVFSWIKTKLLKLEPTSTTTTEEGQIRYDSATKKILYNDGTGEKSPGMSKIEEDPTPKLGGDLDLNGKYIIGNLYPKSTSYYPIGSSSLKWHTIHVLYDTIYTGIKNQYGDMTHHNNSDRTISFYTGLKSYTDDTAVLGQATRRFKEARIGTGGIITDGKITSNVATVFNLPAQSTVPTSPAVGDVYLDNGTNTGDGNPHFRYWNGTSWVDL